MSNRHNEDDILKILSKKEASRKNRLPLTTGEIAEKLDMHRNTAGKYLNEMENKGTVGYEKKGPNKFWYIRNMEEYTTKKLDNMSEILGEIRGIVPDYISGELEEIDKLISNAKKRVKRNSD